MAIVWLCSNPPLQLLSQLLQQVMVPAFGVPAIEARAAPTCAPGREWASWHQSTLAATLAGTRVAAAEKLHCKPGHAARASVSRKSCSCSTLGQQLAGIAQASLPSTSWAWLIQASVYEQFAAALALQQGQRRTCRAAFACVVLAIACPGRPTPMAHNMALLQPVIAAVKPAVAAGARPSVPASRRSRPGPPQPLRQGESGLAGIKACWVGLVLAHMRAASDKLHHKPGCPTPLVLLLLCSNRLLQL